MMLYNLLSYLEHRKIYPVLLSAGAIPFRVNTDFQIYKSYLEEVKNKKKYQAVYNITVKHKCSEATVYRAINNMKQHVDFSEEISLA